MSTGVRVSNNSVSTFKAPPSPSAVSSALPKGALGSPLSEVVSSVPDPDKLLSRFPDGRVRRVFEVLRWGSFYGSIDSLLKPTEVFEQAHLVSSAVSGSDMVFERVLHAPLLDFDVFESVDVLSDGSLRFVFDRSDMPVSRFWLFRARRLFSKLKLGSVSFDAQQSFLTLVFVPGCVFVPSSSPGHGHVYVPFLLSFGRFASLLRVLFRIDVLEYGYCKASLIRKAAFLRCVGVSK